MRMMRISLQFAVDKFKSRCLKAIEGKLRSYHEKGDKAVKPK